MNKPTDKPRPDGFWAGKRVLITGHTGFKGSWLSIWLKQKGAEPIGYALPPPSEPSFFQLADLAGQMTSIEGDIRDLEGLRRVFDAHRPELVIHMAAQTLVRQSYEDPVGTYATNVMGTVNVLEAVRRSPAARVLIVVTSDKCYENREWVWGYRENDPMGGHDPYSSSKGCAELVTAAYRQSYFSDTPADSRPAAVASTRAGNVIGGGDWARDRLVPDIIRAVIARRPVKIRYPHAVRPWQHVLEPLHGYLVLAEKLWHAGGEFGGGWNFGPDDTGNRPVSWLTDYLIRNWGQGARWETDARSNPHEATFLKLDNSKAKARLQWKPRLDLETGLDWTVEWFKAYAGGRNVLEVTLDQLARYEDLG